MAAMSLPLPIEIKDNKLFISKPLFDAAVRAPDPEAIEQLLDAISDCVNQNGSFFLVGVGEETDAIALTGHRRSEVADLRSEVENVRKNLSAPAAE